MGHVSTDPNRIYLRQIGIAFIIILTLMGVKSGVFQNNFSNLAALKSRFGASGAIEPRDITAAQKRMMLHDTSRFNATQPQYWHAIGQTAFLSENFIAAADAFERGTNLHPKLQYVYLALAKTQVRMGKISKALDTYWQAVRISPGENIEPYQDAFEIEMRMQAYEKAITWCTAARTAFPTNNMPDFNQGLANLHLGHPAEAEKFFLAAHIKNPNDPSSMYYLGVVKKDQKDFLSAADYFERAANIDPKLADSCRWLEFSADLFLQASNPKQAERVCRVGLQRCADRDKFKKLLEAIIHEPKSAQ
jgi:tetratricopeptide (TPR) repeat protein